MATYQVGPSQTYQTLGAVPWANILPGDIILLNYSATPYTDKIVLCYAGTASAPIIFRGVLGPNGQRPVIDGTNSVMPKPVNFWNGNRCALKIGGANVPADTMPSYITVENIEFKSARAAYNFTDRDGLVKPHDPSAAGLYIEKGRNITIRNCIFRDCGNGFASAFDTQDLLLEGNYFYDNGLEGSTQQHNSYSEATRITYQFNHFGLLRASCQGNNLKDRSSGCIIRYNWIEGGNRQLDLVDSEAAVINTDPAYRTTNVYGNVLIEPANAGNGQIVHYGGDSGTLANYRKGVLQFYNNTIISLRTDNTTLVRLSSPSESADIRNNIVHSTGLLAILDADGTANLRNNWLKTGWRNSFSSTTAQVPDLGGNITGDNPGFVDEANQDYHLTSTSPCLNKGGALVPNAPLSYQYVKHQASEARPVCGLVDIGAYETVIPVGLRVYAVEFNLKVTNDLTGEDAPCVVFVSVATVSGAEGAISKAKSKLAAMKFPTALVTDVRLVGVGVTAS